MQFKKHFLRDFPGGPVVKGPPHSAGDAGSIPAQEAEAPRASGQLSLQTVYWACMLCSPCLHESLCNANEDPEEHSKDPTRPDKDLKKTRFLKISSNKYPVFQLLWVRNLGVPQDFSWGCIQARATAGLVARWSASKVTQVTVDLLRNTYFQVKSHSSCPVSEPHWIPAGVPEHTGIGSLLHGILRSVGHTGQLASPAWKMREGERGTVARNWFTQQSVVKIGKIKICRVGCQIGDPEKSCSLNPQVCQQSFLFFKGGQSLFY